MARENGMAEYDAVIAGAGAGGGFAAMVLVERGFRVLLLERGERHVAADYPMNHPDWELQPRAFDMGSGLFDLDAYFIKRPYRFPSAKTPPHVARNRPRLRIKGVRDP